jgi:hypothetical protein
MNCLPSVFDEMDEFNFKPSYSFVNVHIGMIFSLFASFLLLYFAALKNSIVALLFSGLFVYALISALRIYPRELVLRSREIIVRRLFLPDVVYSYDVITQIRLLRGRIEFGSRKLYFAGMMNHGILLRQIIIRMQQLNIPINTYEEISINSLMNSLREDE